MNVLENGRLSIGDYIITATPRPPTTEDEYFFGEWDFPPGYESGSAVVEDINISAVFYKDVRLYEVSFASYPSGYGTISVQSPVASSDGVYKIAYGSVITVNGNEVSISDGTIATATPSSPDLEYLYSFEDWTIPTDAVRSDLLITANFSRMANTTVFVTFSTPYGHIYVDDVAYTEHTLEVPNYSEISVFGNEVHIWEYVITVDEEVETVDEVYRFNRWGGIPLEGQAYEGLNIFAQFVPSVRYYNVTFSIADGFGTLNLSTIRVTANTLIYSESNTIVVGSYTITATPSEDSENVTYEFVRWDGLPMSGRILEDTDISAKIQRTVTANAFNIVEIEHGEIERKWSIPEEYLPLMLVIPVMVLIGLVLISLNRKEDGDDYESY